MLDAFVQEGRLSALLWEACQQQAQGGSPELQEALLSRVVCLPDHLSNRLEGESPPVFFPQNYFPRLGAAVIQVLQKISDSLRGEIAAQCCRGGSLEKCSERGPPWLRREMQILGIAEPLVHPSA